VIALFRCLTHTTAQRLRAAGALCLLAALTVLAGCGPTGGGTGTGEAVFGPADFGARPASVCGSALSSQLNCSGNVPTTGNAALDGTVAVYYTGSGAAGPFTLVLQDNRAELQSPCRATRFDGEWGQAANGDTRFFGSWVTPERPTAQPAQMLVQVLQPAGAPGGLQVWVVDTNGGPLLDALALQRTPTLPTTPPLCP
jgi:hypothetical protein